jgi:hypothetical protein
MIVKPAPFPSLGADMVTVLDAVRCAALRGNGIAFVVRYLDSLTQGELETILASGLGCSFVSYAPPGGWIPSEIFGEQGGAQAVRELKALGVPQGATCWTDLEGVSEDAPAANVEAWGNARAGVIQAAGYDAGLYVGAGAGLTAEQLYALAFDRYWKSLSRVPEPECGWSLIQLYPTTTIGGTAVDIDCVQKDYRGRLPAMVWAA